MVNNKKLKNLLHQRNKDNLKKSRSVEKVEFNDDDIAIPFATAEEVKSKGIRHELNRVRRFTAKNFLNKYRYSATDHRLIKPYYYLRQWFNWTGVVADISMPTGSDSTRIDGKVLIDKFCFENEVTGEKEMLDHHIWLNVNNIRYLMNGPKLTLGIGDVIQATSRVMQYSGKGGSVEKFGLGSTVIRAGGILVSYTKNINSPKSQVITSNYDHGDDWVLKLDNSGIPDITLQNYRENKDIRIFANREHGHVLATYQPSRYVHYFERLQDSSSNTPIKEIDEPVLYTATINDFRVYEQDGELVPKIVLESVTNPIGRIVCARKTLDFNEALISLGTLRKGDKISFKLKGDINSLRTNELTKFKLLTPHQTYDLPKETQLLNGWIMNSFFYTPAKDYDLIGKYLHWQQVISREDVDVTEDNFDEYYGLTAKEISKKLDLDIEVVKNYLQVSLPNNSDILYSFIDNNDEQHRYYRPEVLDQVEKHFKHTSQKAQSALERAQAAKHAYSRQVKEKVIAIPRAQDTKPVSDREFERNLLAKMEEQSAKSEDKTDKVAPVPTSETKAEHEHQETPIKKEITSSLAPTESPKSVSEPVKLEEDQEATLDETKSQVEVKTVEPIQIKTNDKFMVKFVCETGTYTSDQFSNFQAVAKYLQQLTEANKLNKFLLVKNESGQDSMISVKQILEVKI
ncbi:hypothetical protein J2Z60_000316 [Lactobacillus colini]|uniref:Uncharacterized protein n=1 Tax=Lactobacillus colini TaxID=1819254 RepID=A0ABS4MCM7_9LACO|nr:hypothetical protein [Lactobacillus colini]MBP2057154.1 hypothetical protein [Lactobacillus colini]